MKAPLIDLSLTPANLGKIVLCALGPCSGQDARFFNDFALSNNLMPVLAKKRLRPCFKVFSAFLREPCLSYKVNVVRNPAMASLREDGLPPVSK